MAKKFYAGIGSRETPQDVLESMQYIAQKLGEGGYTLRSGGADGADTAFYNGANKQGLPTPKVYLPSAWFNGHRHNPNCGFFDSTTASTWGEALELVNKYHPAPDKLTEYARKLMARNAYQILSTTLEDPVDFVICWTKGGKLVGGTAQAMKIAIDFEVQIYNLANVEDVRKFNKEVLC
ncbi:DNA processing protein [Pseudanabaena phage Pam2]|nr:DNA processing protein [Pseudanabaena phage Pam2]